MKKETIISELERMLKEVILNPKLREKLDFRIEYCRYASQLYNNEEIDEYYHYMDEFIGKNNPYNHGGGKLN